MLILGVETVKNVYMRIFTITAPAFCALCCLSPAAGEIGAWLNTWFVNSFGLGRYALSGLLIWLAYIQINRQRNLGAWMYSATVFLFVGALFHTMAGGGYGYIIGAVSSGMLHCIGMTGLVFLTLFFCIAPFLRQRWAFFGRVNGIFETFTYPETEGLLHYIDAEECGIGGIGYYDCSAVCQVLLNILDMYGIRAFVLDVQKRNSTWQFVIQLAAGTRIAQIERLSLPISIALNSDPDVQMIIENYQMDLVLNKIGMQIICRFELNGGTKIPHQWAYGS